VLRAADLVLEGGGALAAPAGAGPAAAAGLDGDLRERERRLIIDAIGQAGSRKAAAERLGISPRTLRHKLQRMRDAGLEVPAGR
jgi:two-component system response regulator FlrC